MASIGSLVADLKLESAVFLSELAKAQKATQTAASSMQRSMSGIQKSFASVGSSAKAFVAGFISVAAVKSLVSLAATAVSTADDIGAAATKIGIGADELQRFRFAAEQTDVSVGELDAALKLFAKNVATGKVAAQGKTITDQFMNLIAQIRAAPSQIDKNRIAVAALGKQYQVALAIAAQSGDQFKKNYNDAFIISTKAINAASDLDNQFRALSNAVTAGFQTGLLEAFADGLKTNEQTLKDINIAAQNMGMAVGTAFKTISQALIESNSLMKQFNDWQIKTAAQAQKTAGPVNATIRGGTSQTIQQLTGQAGAFAGVPGAPQGGHGGAAFGAIKATTDAINDNSVAIDQNMLKQSSWKTTVDDTASSLVSQGKSIADAAKGPMQVYRDQIDALTLALEFGQITQQEFGAASFMVGAQVAQQWTQTAGVVGSALGDIFGQSKGVAIAQAIINTLQGITQALTLPWPLNWIQAAAVAASGFAQVAKIKSTKPQKLKGAFHGGSFEVRGAGGVDQNLVAMRLTRGERVDVTPAGERTNISAGGAMTVNVPGFTISKLYEGDGVRKLMNAIGVAIDDGATFGRHRWAGT